MRTRCDIALRSMLLTSSFSDKGLVLYTMSCIGVQSKVTELGQAGGVDSVQNMKLQLDCFHSIYFP